MVRWVLIVGAVWLVAGTGVALVFGRIARLSSMPDEERTSAAEVHALPAARPQAAVLAPEHAVVVHGVLNNLGVVTGGLAALREGSVPPDARDSLLSSLAAQAGLAEDLLRSVVDAAPADLVARLDALAAAQVDLARFLVLRAS